MCHEAIARLLGSMRTCVYAAEQVWLAAKAECSAAHALRGFSQAYGA